MFHLHVFNSRDEYTYRKLSQDLRRKANSPLLCSCGSMICVGSLSSTTYLDRPFLKEDYVEKTNSSVTVNSTTSCLLKCSATSGSVTVSPSVTTLIGSQCQSTTSGVNEVFAPTRKLEPPRKIKKRPSSFVLVSNIQLFLDIKIDIKL